MATRKARTGSGGVRRKSGSARIGSARAGSENTRQVFPTVEQIRQRAYELYLSRGADHGDEMEDWLNAERELMESLK